MAFLGVIGGLGPMASAYFTELLTAMTDAKRDQDHLKMMMYSVPSLPDRTEYILGRSTESPLPGLVEAGKTLSEAGVECLAIPCVTAHYFHNEIERQVGVPVIHAIRECAWILKKAGVSKVGLLATDGTVQSGLFQSEFEKHGLTVVLPGEEAQKQVMSFIYDDVKKGSVPALSRFDQVRGTLVKEGAEVVLLGCTELSLLKKEYGSLCGVLDVMEVLAKASLEACGMPVRKEYENLIDVVSRSEAV
jgi:aspartate racemase